MLGAELLLLLFWGAALAPDSALGQWLIERPARWLAALTPRRAAVCVVSAALVLAFIVAAPEMVSLFGLVDFSLLMDVAALGLVVGAGARVSAARESLRRLPAMVLRSVLSAARPRGRRLRRRSAPRPSRADDTDGPAWAFA